MNLQFNRIYQRTFKVAETTESIILGNFRAQVLSVDISPSPTPSTYHWNVGWLWAQIESPPLNPTWLKQYKILNSKPRLCVFPFDIYRLIFFPRIYYSETASFAFNIYANKTELTDIQILLLMGQNA